MFSKRLTVVGAGSRAEVSNPFPRATLPPPYQWPEDEVRGHDWLREWTSGVRRPSPGPRRERQTRTLTTLISSLSNHCSLSSDLDHMSGRKAVFRRVTQRRESTSPGDPAVLVLSLTWKFTFKPTFRCVHVYSHSRDTAARLCPTPSHPSSPRRGHLLSHPTRLSVSGSLEPPPLQWVSLHSFV